MSVPAIDGEVEALERAGGGVAGNAGVSTVTS